MSSHASDRQMESISPYIRPVKADDIRNSQMSVRPSSTARTVITSPPWAKDEPPTPTGELPLSPSAHSLHPRPSQSGTITSQGESSTSTSQATYGQPHTTSWWTFTRKGREEGPPPPTEGESTKLNDITFLPPSKSEKRKPFRERSMTWISNFRSGSDEVHRERDEERGLDLGQEDRDRHDRHWGFHIPVPARVPLTLTIAQNDTPGWDTPWTPRAQPLPSMSGDAEARETNADESSGSGKEQDLTVWARRRKRLRVFFLNNTYVPLLFRVINITFTISALIVAVNIRNVERRYNIMGAVGSSPMLVIIFAPPTLVHVISAVYLEYFGRPLGLWRTSKKLIHTLSETLFICLWSAALALCFDNYFTSVIGCVSPSAIDWYNEIPRIIPNIPNIGRGDGQPGDDICDHQVALICLVFVGLVMYCSNLFISLFRIFERVKYHPVPTNQ